MGIVTAIELQKRRKNRFNIYVDGEFVLGIDAPTLAGARLRVGDQVTEEGIQKLIERTSLDELLNKVYKFLAFRPRTEKEIWDYLSKKKVGRAVINLIVARLKSKGYINDREFAQWWVEQRNKFRPKGKCVLKRELLGKGLVKEVVEEVLETQINEQELAFKVAQKRYPKYRKLDQREFSKKMGYFLARRGFNWETIKEVVDKSQKDR